MLTLFIHSSPLEEWLWVNKQITHTPQRRCKPLSILGWVAGHFQSTVTWPCVDGASTSSMLDVVKWTHAATRGWYWSRLLLLQGWKHLQNFVSIVGGLSGRESLGMQAAAIASTGMTRTRSRMGCNCTWCFVSYQSSLSINTVMS